MGVLLKCFLGIFAIFCLMQFVKMDDSAASNGNSLNLDQIIKDAMDKLGIKETAPEKVGEFVSTVAGALQEAIKDGVKNVGELAGKVQTAVKDNLQTE